jgi:hypothetical protein
LLLLLLLAQRPLPCRGRRQGLLCSSEQRHCCRSGSIVMLPREYWWLLSVLLLPLLLRLR